MEQQEQQQEQQQQSESVAVFAYLTRLDSSRSAGSTESSNSSSRTNNSSCSSEDDHEEEEGIMAHYERPPSPPPSHNLLMTIGRWGLPFVENAGRQNHGSASAQNNTPLMRNLIHNNNRKTDGNSSLDVSFIGNMIGDTCGTCSITQRRLSRFLASILSFCCPVSAVRAWSHVSKKLYMSVGTIRVLVLLVLCLQNSLFTVLRRYSHGLLNEKASKYEILFVGEVIKMIFSAFMIQRTLSSHEIASHQAGEGNNLYRHLCHITAKSGKMVVLAIIYGIMNILSFVSLRYIGAGMFSIFAQCKILSTATFSTILLERQYSATKWRAMISLIVGVLLFSENIWVQDLNNSLGMEVKTAQKFQHMVGVLAVVIEVTLSGFASIYFEKVIKTDSFQINIWEHNFQLALASFPVYLAFIIADNGGHAGHVGGGWTWISGMVSLLGAAGGLLVALSIKYSDAILKTLATTGSIVLSSILDHVFLGGVLSSHMVIAGIQVILAIFDYTFDQTPESPSNKTSSRSSTNANAMNMDPEKRKISDEGRFYKTGTTRMAPMTVRRSKSSSSFNRKSVGTDQLNCPNPRMSDLV